MFDKRGFEGELLEKGQSAVANVSKGTKKQASDFGKSAVGQVSGSNSGSGSDSSSANANTDQGTNEAGSANQNQQQSQMTDEERVEFLRNLYGKSDNNSKKSQGSVQSQKPQKNPLSNALGLPQNDPNKGKTPEEIAKLNALRDRLHKEEYYIPTFNPPKREEQEAEQVEQAQEEQGEQMAKIEKEEKKKQEKLDLAGAVRRGTAEIRGGVGG